MSDDGRETVSIDVCVVVAAAGTPRGFDRCIESLCNQRYGTCEIIIVDDGLSDIARGYIQPYLNRVRVLHNTGRGPSAARNAGVQATTALYVAFIDSDCIADSMWASSLRAVFDSHPDAAAVGGYQDIPVDAGAFEKKVFLFFKKAGFAVDYIKQPAGSIRRVSHNPSCTVMYRRADFLKAGGFCEGLWPSEDLELDYRLSQAGKHLYYTPDATVAHYRPQNYKAFCRMMYRYGFSGAFLAWRYGYMRLIYAAPVSLIILCAGLVTAVVGGWLAVYIGCLMILFAGLLAYVQFDMIIFSLFVTSISIWSIGFMRGLVYYIRQGTKR